MIFFDQIRKLSTHLTAPAVDTREDTFSLMAEALQSNNVNKRRKAKEAVIKLAGDKSTVAHVMEALECVALYESGLGGIQYSFSVDDRYELIEQVISAGVITKEPEKLYGSFLTCLVRRFMLDPNLNSAELPRSVECIFAIKKKRPDLRGLLVKAAEDKIYGSRSHTRQDVLLDLCHRAYSPTIQLSPIPS